MGSALHGVLPPLQPAHGKITRLRVYRTRLNRPIQTRFRSGSPSRVNLATYGNSLAHSSKGTPSRPASSADDALTVCKPTVSGTISLPSRGAFHLSLTVLVHYRSFRVFSLTSWSRLLPTGFLVSRGTHGSDLPRCHRVSSTGLSPSLATRSSNVRLP